MNIYRFLLLYCSCLVCATANDFSCISTESSGTCTEENIDCTDDDHRKECKPTVDNPPKMYAVKDIDDCKAKYSTNNLYSGTAKGSTINLFPYPENNEYFGIDIDWDDAFNSEAYYIEVSVIPRPTSGQGTTLPHALSKWCKVGKDASNITIYMQYGFYQPYATCMDSKRELLITVQSLPSGDSPFITSFNEIWPNNCYDIEEDENICGPHFPVGADISIETILLPNSTTEMAATVYWSNPLNTIFNVTLYKIILVKNSDYTNLHDLTANNTRSITIAPLDKESVHTFYLMPIQNAACQYECVEEDQSMTISKCGTPIMKEISYVPPPLPSPSPSSSPSLSVSPSLSLKVVTSTNHVYVDQTSLSSSSFLYPFSSALNSPLTNNDTPLQVKYIKEITGGAAVVLFVALVFGVILTIFILKQRLAKHTQQIDNGEDALKTSSSEDSSVPSTRSATPMSPWSPSPLSMSEFTYPEISPVYTIMEPKYYNPPTPSSDVKLVLVIESLRLSKDDSLCNYAFLGQKLNEYSDIHVLHYNKCSRETPSGWLMKHMMRADVVLCVCTNEFSEEWKGQYKEGSLVYSLYDYVVGCKNKGLSLSHKYITVVYNDKDTQYIPMVFNSVRHCTIDNTETIYRLITQTIDVVVS